MKTATLDRAFTVFLFLLGLFVVYAAWGYGLYSRGVPGPGFFPAIAGVMMAGLAGGILVRDMRQQGRIKGEIPLAVALAIFGVCASVLLVVFLAETIGMAAITFVAAIAIGFITEEPGKRDRGFVLRLVATAFGMVALCHVLFGRVIGIPLISGVFGF